MVKYVPKQGDIIFFDFNPVKGHEQGGQRPAVVISEDVFNKYAHMVIVLPISSNVKEFPTHYEIQYPKKIKGSVLCEHVRSIDYHIRNIQYVEKCSDIDFENIIDLFKACI